jgi:dUTPase
LAAGYDIIAVDDPIIVGEAITKEGDFTPFYKRIDYIEYHTTLYISPQTIVNTTTFPCNKEVYHTLLHPRSSVRKYNLVLANSIGLVDNDYRGEIIMCFKYVWQPENFVMEYRNDILTGNILGKLDKEKIYKKGDKIGQLVAELTNPMEFKLVSELDITERGEGGFGSSDKKEVIVDPIKVQSEFKHPEIHSTHNTEEHKPSYGVIIDQYTKSGGIPVKKKYTDEIKERNSQ